MPIVENRGDFSIRGDIVDVYPPASNNPTRIEFYDNTIESLREFDNNSQVSLNVIDRVEILPVREVSPNEFQKVNGLGEIAKLAKEQNADSVRLKELNDKILALKRETSDLKDKIKQLEEELEIEKNKPKIEEEEGDIYGDKKGYLGSNTSDLWKKKK